MIKSKIQQAYKSIVDRLKNYFYPTSTNDSDKNATKNSSTGIDLTDNTNEYTEYDDTFHTTTSNTPRSPTSNLDDAIPGANLVSTPYNQLAIINRKLPTMMPYFLGNYTNFKFGIFKRLYK